MHLRLRDFDDQPVLAGADRGKRTFVRLIERLASSKIPEVLFLDFDEVDLASASFLREAIINVKNWCRSSRSKLFPVVANANVETLAELAIICELQSDAIVACDIDDKERPSSISLIGELEEKQRGAFDFVQTSGRATARDLMNASTADRSLSPTAWNNRLNVLVQKGIIMETSSGRTKVFTPLLMDDSNGH
jgi:hypothetical protein